MLRSSSSLATTPSSRWWSEPECWLLALIVVVIYFSRLTALPVAGEEARWASGAMEMIATGDWIVPRQQGQVFPERPPMSSWAMAAVGLFWGQVDEVAIRLPSVTAVLLTCLVIYGYGRLFLTRFGAFTAGAIYATMGQVLQLGRVGESEALFALLVSASLLIWHAGHLRSWPSVWTWSAGYALAGLARWSRDLKHLCTLWA